MRSYHLSQDSRRIVAGIEPTEEAEDLLMSRSKYRLNAGQTAQSILRRATIEETETEITHQERLQMCYAIEKKPMMLIQEIEMSTMIWNEEGLRLKARVFSRTRYQ